MFIPISASEQREAFVHILDVHRGLPHVIKRNDIFGDIIALYKQKGESLLKEYPFRVRFHVKLGVDGGVARDIFSAF